MRKACGIMGRLLSGINAVCSFEGSNLCGRVGFESVSRTVLSNMGRGLLRKFEGRRRFNCVTKCRP